MYTLRDKFNKKDFQHTFKESYLESLIFLRFFISCHTGEMRCKYGQRNQKKKKLQYLLSWNTLIGYCSFRNTLERAPHLWCKRNIVSIYDCVYVHAYIGCMFCTFQLICLQCSVFTLHCNSRVGRRKRNWNAVLWPWKQQGSKSANERVVRQRIINEIELDLLHDLLPMGEFNLESD